jgi:heme-degrading monooxygenase HmoA
VVFARVTTYEIPLDRLDEGMEAARRVAGEAALIPGYKSGYWTLDRSTGRGVSLTVWETEEELRASEERARELRAVAATAAGLNIASIEIYEVVASN